MSPLSRQSLSTAAFFCRRILPGAEKRNVNEVNGILRSA